MPINSSDFQRALDRADLTEGPDELYELVGMTAPSRSYFVRYKGKLHSLKAVANLAYDLKGERHPNYHTHDYVRRFRDAFEIVHSGPSTELQRLKRQREIASRWARPQQAAFRNMLLDLFSGRCIVSGCSSQEAIDAAHVQGVDGQGEDLPSNGILIRADLHRLFDAHLMAINPSTGQVRFHKTCQADYAILDGQIARLPRGGPPLASFKDRWKRFNVKANSGAGT